MKIVFKLGPRPPPPRDYVADETSAAESLLMLSQFPSPLPSSNPSAATQPSTPATAAVLCVKKIQDWSLLPPLASNFPYVCDVCGESFKSHQALGGHKTRHRPKPTTARAVSGSDRVHHECSMWPERFSSGQAHKRKHFVGTIGGGASKRVKTSSSGSCLGSSGLTTVVEDDHASTSNLLGLDLNLPYTHNFFE